MSLYEKFRQGSVIALSRIISHIEDYAEGYQELLAALYRIKGNIYRIGLTGPPGAGKSSLVNRIAARLATEGNKVAIVCIDPSSPFTGGALLGDRLRMQDIPSDKGVYIRSMGSRGSSGGLAQATSNVVVALDAFGFDTVIIETVGVGQMEMDVIDECDTVVVTLVPESGDAIQALKAGLMEIADVFAVNKADRDGSQQMVYDLQSALEMRSQKAKWDVPIIPTQATVDKNCDKLLESILSHRSYLENNGELRDKRARQLRKRVEAVVLRRIQLDMAKSVMGETVLDEIVEKILRGEDDPFTAGRALYEKFKAVR